jgi:DNA invertase Pin-like site-specific DNA recombinase
MRIWGYLRHARDTDPQTVDQRVAALEAGAKRFDGTWVGAILDTDVPGETIPRRRREGYRRLLRAIERGDLLLVHRLEEIDDSPRELLKALKLLARLRINVHAIRSHRGRRGLILTPDFVLAFLELTKEVNAIHGQAVRRGLERRREAGEASTGTVPLGYRRIIRDGKKIDVLDQGDLQVMAEIHARRSRGQSMRRIGKDLHETNARTAARRRWVKRGRTGKLDLTRLYRAHRAYKQMLETGELTLGSDGSHTGERQ